MPIYMDIMCESCRRVHFVATSRGIKPSQSVGMYRLHCDPPCPEFREFRKENMRAFRVSEDVFRSGSAREGEYELVHATKPSPERS